MTVWSQCVGAIKHRAKWYSIAGNAQPLWRAYACGEAKCRR